jgi:hypothetical protein
LVVGFHEDVSRAEVDFVGAFRALDAEEFIGEGALGRDSEAWEEVGEDFFADLCGGGEVVKGVVKWKQSC